MEEGRGLKDDSNSLYERAKNASELAKKAQEDGLKVADDAKKMLELLKVNHLQVVTLRQFTRSWAHWHTCFTF